MVIKFFLPKTFFFKEMPLVLEKFILTTWFEISPKEIIQGNCYITWTLACVLMAKKMFSWWWPQNYYFWIKWSVSEARVDLIFGKIKINFHPYIRKTYLLEIPAIWKFEIIMTQKLDLHRTQKHISKNL